MGDIAKKLMQKSKPDKNGRRSDLPKDDDLPPDEQRALQKIRSEAARAGSFLTSGGKGGLRPSLVLGVMRRDEWRCKKCGELGNEIENGGLSVHHANQHIQNPKVRAKGIRANEEGRRNDPGQLHSVCAKCHDDIHEEDRDENPGEPDADKAAGR